MLLSFLIFDTMKNILLSCLFLCCFSVCFANDVDTVNTSVNSEPINKENCTCKGKRLYGKVKIVDSYPDFTVKVVDSYPDLKVKIVNSYPDVCGKWKFVDSYPDFTIKYVDSYPGY